MSALLPLVPFLLLANPSPTIRLSADSPPAVEVRGLAPADLEKLEFRLSVAGVADAPALTGTHRIVDGVFRFEPRFPLVPGTKYRAVARVGEAETAVELSVPRPIPPPAGNVVAIFPTAAKLPENTLRLYIQFSAPMTRGDAYSHIRFLDEAGKPLPSPFLELGEELWSPDGTRFTLLFDPGRVKRGLKPREEDGPTLEMGKRYTLVVDRTWCDEHGTPLRQSFRKEILAGPPDEEPVNLGNWSITPPAGKSHQPVLVRLPKPLDHALLQRLVWVEDADGKKVEGSLRVGGGDRVISFAPTNAWVPGKYRIVADTRLEDPCGNRVGEAFEVDILKPIQRKVESATGFREFSTR